MAIFKTRRIISNSLLVKIRAAHLLRNLTTEPPSLGIPSSLQGALHATSLGQVVVDLGLETWHLPVSLGYQDLTQPSHWPDFELFIFPASVYSYIGSEDAVLYTVNTERMEGCKHRSDFKTYL